MAIDYSGRASLANDPAFRGRVKIACLTYAYYIVDEPSSTPAHHTRQKWADDTMKQPDVIAQNVAQNVVNDPAVIAAGADVTDADLQVATETTVNKML